MTTITTRQIADVTGKPHSDVLKAVRVFFEKSCGDLNEYVRPYKSNNREYIQYELDTEIAEKFLLRFAPDTFEKLGLTRRSEIVTEPPTNLFTLKDIENLPLPTPSEVDGMTMSSLEIAKLTEKLHHDVLRDIRKVLESIGNTESNFACSYLDASGKANPVYNLPYRETMILITGYSIPLRAKVVDRWQEIEKAKTSNTLTMPNFTDPAEAAIAWAAQYRKSVEAKRVADEAIKVAAQKTEQLALAAPKVQFYDDVVSSENWMTMMEAAKALGVGRIGLMEFMRSVKLLMRAPNLNAAYDQCIKSGCFRTDVKVHQKPDGATVIYNNTVVSGKGLALIQKRIGENPHQAGLYLKYPKVTETKENK